MHKIKVDAFTLQRKWSNRGLRGWRTVEMLPAGSVYVKFPSPVVPTCLGSSITLVDRRADGAVERPPQSVVVSETAVVSPVGDTVTVVLIVIGMALRWLSSSVSEEVLMKRMSFSTLSTDCHDGWV